MDQKLRTERRKLADLKAAEYNPRKALTPDDAEYQKIRRSIEEFGYVDPIIINEDGTIIGGHQRATVLKDLGYQEVDVVVVALDKQREKALNIALNKITGEWDEVKLKDLLLDLDLGDYDISLTGFEQNDLTELVDKLAIEPEAVDDDFNEDEALERAEAEPVTKLGDVWLLGRHRLMCGDSTSQDDMAVLMNGEIADLVVTDPPYNVNYGDKAEMLDEYLPAKGHRNINHIKNDNMDNQSFYSFLLATYQSAYEFMRAGAAIYVFHAESTGHIFRQAFLDAGLKLAQCLIWEKNAFVLGRQDYQWRHPILYRSHQYEVGDSLPADDESMVQAWLDAGTAVWSEGKQEKAKATPATATAGLAGESKNGETPENVVGRVPKTPTRSKGAKKNG